MRIIYTYISNDKFVPEYTKYSIEMARKNNPCVPIDFICSEYQDCFKDYDITWIDQKQLANGELLKSFNQVCDFKRHGKPNTVYPSSHDFWHRTAERIFYLQEYVSRNVFTDIFHLENDVLIFYPVEASLPDTSGEKISVIRMSHTHTTFAYCHIPRSKLLEKLCLAFIEMLEFIGENNMMTHGGYDHISEMSLLNLALRNNIVRSFDILPNGSRYVYDPGSYGQYFGGTNNGHGPGFTDPTHYIGSAIISKTIEPFLENGKPMTGNTKIFNLHIHSKNLKDFVA